MLECIAYGNSLLININAEIDHHTSYLLREKMDKEINRKDIKNIVFDFKNVSFMDSSGVGLIIGRYKVIEKIGGKVAIVNTNPKIKRIFEISGLFKIIRPYNDIQAAISEFERGENNGI